MRLALLLLSAMLLLSCSPKEPLYNTQTYVFGTLVDISIYGETDQRAQTVSTAIINDFNTLHQRLHAWKPSEISTINTAFAKGENIAVSPDINKMLVDMAKLSTMSNNIFNPTIGKLINTWGFQNDVFKPQTIDDDNIKQLVSKNPTMSDIKITDGQVHSINPAVQLDLGGYAKGYALDKGLTYLRTQNIQHALINIGGNIIALGQHGDKPWRVGIQHPRQPNAIATIALASGWAIGTSGDYQRFFDLDGQRYCHIIDPRTGYPAQHMQSVTVLVPPSDVAGALSDVASKPIFLAKPNMRANAAQSMGIKHFLIIESEQQIAASAPMLKQLHWLDTTAEKLVRTVDLE
jgi:thiamine biosynthesis lipoprotein